MDIVSIQDALSKPREYGVLLYKINMLNSTEGKLLIDASRIADDAFCKGLVDALNSINDQGIQSINLQNYTYQVNSRTLPLASLCTAEKIFLFAYIADQLKAKIILYSDMKQLTESVLKAFFRLFGQSDYVDVSYESNKIQRWFSSTRKEIADESLDNR